MLDILVFGSCFVDYIAYCDRIPSPGETLTSNSFAKGFGGKGANQAFAAARLGARAGMAGCVGDDGDGHAYVKNMKDNGCDVSLLRTLKDKSTGLALIAVDKNARNAIVICPNAAGSTGFVARDYSAKLPNTFTKEDILRILKPGGIFIAQNEIPFEATLAALRVAHEAGMYTIFNPAPAPSAEQIQQLRPFLKYVTLVCPNEHEAFLMSGVKVECLKSAGEAIKVLRSLGCRDVVITMGHHGCAVQARDQSEPVLAAPHRVTAVDTTGAGDCFVGSLAYFLRQGHTLSEACQVSNKVAAMSVTRKGTQSSYLPKDQLPQEWFVPKRRLVSKL